AAGLIADAAAAEGGDDAAVAPLVVVETDEGPVVPGQDATGEALRDTLVAIAAELEGDDRVVLAVGHPALDRPATALALAEPGRVRALGWGDARFELTRLTRDEHHRLDVLGERVRSFRPPVEAIRTAPTDDEQAWLLERLAELCAAVGAAPFIAPPLEPRDIVGEFHGDASSIHRLLRGLMDFVGLRDARVELLIADGTAVGHRPPGGEGRVTLAWFSGFDHTGQSALFGFDPARHAEPEDVLATLAHEVAHAFRVRRGLMVDDRDEEELLTDLTASFLGFGISLTNSAYRYRTGGEVTGTRVTHWTEVRTGGYLPAQAFAWLLALQVVARRGGWRDARAVARRLEANQASWFRASLRSLAPRAEALRAGLGVAHADVPRGRAARRRLVLGVASSPGDVTVDRGIKGLAVVDRLGQPVFRVARRGREPLTWALAFLGFFAFLASGLFDGAARIAVASGSVAAVVGLLTFGPRERGDACSGCSSVLPEAATRCPRCRGDVSGRIATVGEHDAAAAAARPGGHRSGA
ncbi:MAG: hypothetical protein KC635_29640, partial [Myxococcales bacterium]|nr:hypothetical protein [Myxococcales bacterium]